MSRKTYVWKLVVEYPDQPNWAAIEGYRGGPTSYHSWNWPKRVTYLSQAGAEQRALLLRTLGATVTIVKSDPVEFPSLEEAQQRKLEHQRAQTDVLVENFVQLHRSLQDLNELSSVSS